MEVIDVEVAAFALMKNDAFRQHVVGHKLGHWALHGLTLSVPFLHIQGIVCEQWSCEQCQLLRGDGEDAARLHFCRSFKRQEKNLSWYLNGWRTTTYEDKGSSCSPIYVVRRC